MTSPDSRRRSLQDVIDSAVARGQQEIYATMPAQVVKWDASKQRADVKVLVKQVFEDEAGKRQAQSWTVFTGVPVQMDGGGEYRTTYPIADGKTTIDQAVPDGTFGVLHFAYASLDKWLSGDGREVDPEIDHYHSPSDAFFVPGIRPFGRPWSSCPTDHMTVGHDAGVQIHVHKTVIVAGDEAAAQFVALANLTKARLDTLQNAHDTHKHTGVTSGVGSSAVPDVIVGPLADVAATKLKAE